MDSCTKRAFFSSVESWKFVERSAQSSLNHFTKLQLVHAAMRLWKTVSGDCTEKSALIDVVFILAGAIHA